MLMSKQFVDRLLLRRYLLGQADEAEAERIERDYLAREEAADAVANAEQDLIEDYLEGRCPPDVRQRVQTHYLASPVHIGRMEIVRAIKARAGAPRQSRRFLAPLTLAAMLLLGVSAGLLYWNVSLRTGAILLEIPAVAVRSEGAAPTLDLGDGSRPVELRLERLSADGAPPFRAAVRTVEGEELWQGTATPAGPEEADRPGMFVVEIPAGVLRPGDHVVAVLDSEGSASRERYYFRAIAP
jgi:hypothetical protein